MHEKPIWQLFVEGSGLNSAISRPEQEAALAKNPKDIIPDLNQDELNELNAAINLAITVAQGDS